MAFRTRSESCTAQRAHDLRVQIRARAIEGRDAID